MKTETKIPLTYLENIDMINSATNFNKLYLKSNYNMPLDTQNTLNYSYNKVNEFYKTQNDMSTNMPSSTQKFFVNSNKNFINQEINFPRSYTLNKLNNAKKFAWKEIMDNNNTLIFKEKELENPLIKNILNSNLDENEIKNTPQNYLVNLIQTLQGMANQVLENRNNLEKDNQKLYDEIFEANNNYNTMKENNMQMNKSIILLKQQNNEQKNLINDFENRNDLYEFDKLESKNIQLNNYLEKYDFKKKYYCKYCANKVFKTKYYLDSHIKRRHNDYFQSNYIKENKKIKSNIQLYSKKLDEFKKSYESLVNANIRKAQYKRLNEKINGLENLILMSKAQDDIINNILIYNNFYYDGKNDNNNNEENDEQLKSKKEDEKREYQNKINSLRKDMTHFLNKARTEIMEINREKKFQKIKRYFERGPKFQVEYNSPTHNRKDQKVKTIKAENLNINMFNYNENDRKSEGEIKNEIEVNNQSMKKSKTKDTFKNKNKDKKDEITNNDSNNNYIINSNINNNEINNNIDNPNLYSKKNINMNINNINNINIANEDENQSKRSKFSDKSSEEKRKISFSYSENENPIKKFYDDFRERDAQFSYGKKEYYLKSIISNDYKIDKKKVENLVEEKINNKLNKIDQNNNENLVQEIMNLNYKILDPDLNGVVYCFYSRNISMLMDTKKLINETNNYYYHIMDFKDMKSLKDRNREANQNLFETVNYKIKYINSLDESQNKINNNSIEENEFSLKNYQ